MDPNIFEYLTEPATREIAEKAVEHMIAERRKKRVGAATSSTSIPNSVSS